MSNDIYTEDGRLEAIAEMEKEIAEAEFNLDEVYVDEDMSSDEYFDSLPDDYEFDLEDDGLDESDYMYY